MPQVDYQSSAVLEQLVRAERLARELTTQLEAADRCNRELELALQQNDRALIALEARIGELEAIAQSVIALQPGAMLKALQDWLKSDSKAVANAILDLFASAEVAR
jgi:hypothetical protein